MRLLGIYVLIVFCNLLVYNYVYLIIEWWTRLEQKILRDKLSKVLFHGTLMNRAANIVLDGIDFSKLNDRADFGKGFYVTDSYALAENTAKLRYHQEKLRDGTAYPPVVMRIKVNCTNIDKYIIKEFYGETDIWKRFVCTNRWNRQVLKKFPEYDNNYDLKYDIIIGLTADGKMKNIDNLIRLDSYSLSNSFLKNINPYLTYYKDKTTNSLKETKSYQISFHNMCFIKSCIRFMDYDILLVRKEDGL